MKIFYGLVHKDNDSAFGITFPDAPGCFSAADEEVRPADECTGSTLTLRRRCIRSTDTDDCRLLRDKDVATEIAAGAFFSPCR